MTYAKAHARRRPIGVIAMIVLAGAFAYLLATAFAGPGGAASSVAKANLKYVNVGADEFQPDAGCVGGTDFDYDGYSGAIEVSSSCTFEAPASLPDKGKIASITAFYSPTDGSASFHLEANDDFGDHVDLVTGTLDDCGTEFCSRTFQLDPKAVVSAASTHYGIYLPVSPGTSEFTLYRFRVELTNKGQIAGTPTSFPNGTNGGKHDN
jgi:hypothetical protein